MKTKIFTTLLGFTVISAIMLSCVALPLKNESYDLESIENSSETSKNNISVSESESSTPASREESQDVSETEPPDTQSIDWSFHTEQECDSYFKDSVFVGDSVMLGFKNYVAAKRQSNVSFFSTAKFHAGGSYGVYNALQPATSDSVHPVFAGAPTPIEDALPLLGAKRVFIFFGVNDIGLYGDGTGPEKTVENYDELFSRIKQKSPDIEIVVLSATYLYEDWEKEQIEKYTTINLTSENLRKFNQLMLEYCNEHDMDYIDVATALATDDGYLKPEVCSEQKFHINNYGYKIWTDIFRAYAAAKLDGNYKNVKSIVGQFQE